MSELDALVIRGHQKIIDHYGRLRDSALTDEERARFQRCMEEEERALQDFFDRRSRLVRRAA
jgi:hypothetical protein